MNTFDVSDACTLALSRCDAHEILGICSLGCTYLGEKSRLMAAHLASFPHTCSLRLASLAHLLFCPDSSPDLYCTKVCDGTLRGMPVYRCRDNTVVASAPLAGASIASWLMLPHNSLSLGASGAVFGLYAVSVLLKLSNGEARM